MRNPRWHISCQGLLPTHANLQDAAHGFKNLGQFVAAAHLSHNLGIPFDQLKSMMTGTRHDSLGKAIHTLKPDADSKAEVKAGHEAGRRRYQGNAVLVAPLSLGAGAHGHERIFKARGI